MDLANLVGLSQSTISLIETGKRDTLYDIRELLRFTDACHMPREALVPIFLGEERTLGEDGALDADRDHEVHRRSFNGSILALAAFSGFHSAQPSGLVDAAHIRYLRSCVDRLRGRDGMLGGKAILVEGLRQLAHSRRLLDEGDYTDKIGRELLAVSADLGVLCGWLAYDSGEQQLARSLYGEAELLAGSADEADILIHVYANMAQQSSHLAGITDRPGFARESLRFADRAAQVARHHASPRLHALIAIRQALAHARLGDASAFRRALTRARRELDRGPHPDDPPWAAFVAESEIAGYEALGLLYLGSPSEKSVRLYRVVLDDKDRSPRDQAYYRAMLADAHVREGDHTQAVSEGLVVLSDLGDRLTSARVLDALRPVRAVADRIAAEEFSVRFDTATRSLTA